MFSTLHMRPSWDLLKWMVVITLAGAIALWLAGTVKGVGLQDPTRRLDNDVVSEAWPLPWPPARLVTKT